jgi:hypothetical protein
MVSALQIEINRRLLIGKGQIKRYIKFINRVFINADKMNSNTYLSRQLTQNRIVSAAAVSLDSLQLLLLP